MRSEILDYLDLKNAEARARWARLYFSGHFCDDRRTSEERARFEAWYQSARAAVDRFLWGAQ
jgi:hypothetical protein